MEKWFKINKTQRLISLRFMPKYLFRFHCSNNGAKKGIDNCYDFNMHFFGIWFSYTNFDYNKN